MARAAAQDRNGDSVPYFTSGGWRWTDGGLQADLPKARLSELFNVNQFIVSQVNPLYPFFRSRTTGIGIIPPSPPGIGAAAVSAAPAGPV